MARHPIPQAPAHVHTPAHSKAPARPHAQVRGFNLALSDRPRNVTSFGGACDFENYYVEGGEGVAFDSLPLYNLLLSLPPSPFPLPPSLPPSPRFLPFSHSPSLPLPAG